MTSYLLLNNGIDYLLLNGGGAARLLLNSSEDGTAGDNTHATYYDHKFSKDYDLAQKRRAIKEEEVIEMRLRAQAALLEIRQAEKQRGKQARARIDRLQRDYDNLLEEIAVQMAALEQMRILNSNLLAYILLSAAMPLTRITFH